MGKKESLEKVDRAGAETSEESLSVTDSTAEMAPTEEFYRPIEYDDLVGTEVAARLQWILCLDCYIKENYVVKGRFKRTNDGEKPTFVEDDSPPIDFSVTAIPSENTEGIFKPILRNGLSKEMIEWLINKHIIDTINDCLPK